MTLVAYIVAWSIAVLGAAVNLPFLAVVGTLGFLGLWAYHLVHAPERHHARG
jgi:hypothetical protein